MDKKDELRIWELIVFSMIGLLVGGFIGYYILPQELTSESVEQDSIMFADGVFQEYCQEYYGDWAYYRMAYSFDRTEALGVQCKENGSIISLDEAIEKLSQQPQSSEKR